MSAFGSLDWIVLGGFFALLVGIVIWVLRQREENSTDYFLAGRDAGWLVIGASIFAANIGSEHLVGLAGAGADTGMAFAPWEMAAWLILILGWVFVPFYTRSRVFTMPEFLELRYCPAARTLLSGISLISYVLTKVSVTVYAGGTVFKTVLGIDTMFGIDFFWVGAIGLVVITGLYTVFGGMKAVLYTSVLQTPVLLIGSMIIVIIGLSKLGGWGELERICGENMHIVRPASDPNFPWPGVFLGVLIIGFWYFCTDQYIVQRVLSARNQKQARRGAIFAGYLKLTPVFIFLVPGMIAFALNQKGLINLGVTAEGNLNSDAAFPMLVRELLPVGVKGLVVGGHLVFVGRVATTVIVVLGVLWIPVMKGLGKVLYMYLQDVQSLLAPGISAAFVMGVFFKRTTAAGGLAGLIFGFTVGLFRLGLNIFKPHLTEGSIIAQIQSINWLYFCAILFFLCIAVTFLVSLVTKPPRKEQLQGLTYGSSTPEQIAETRESWNNWDIFHTVVILSVIVSFFWYFW